MCVCVCVCVCVRVCVCVFINLFKFIYNNSSSAGVLQALVISPRSPVPSSAWCDTVKPLPTKALPLR